MQGSRGIRIVAVVALCCAIAAASVSATPALAAGRDSTGKVTGTVSCATWQGSLQISAFAYRPSLGYAAAIVFTGPPNTPATIQMVDVETDKSNYTLDHGCSKTKKSVPLTHRGLSSAGVVKAGYNQSLTAYCGAPAHVVVRYRIGLASSGKPATATMTIWGKRKKTSKLHQIGYVQWSRSRSITYYSKKSCVAQY